MPVLLSLLPGLAQAEERLRSSACTLQQLVERNHIASLNQEYCSFCTCRKGGDSRSHTCSHGSALVLETPFHLDGCGTPPRKEWCTLQLGMVQSVWGGVSGASSGIPRLSCWAADYNPWAHVKACSQPANIPMPERVQIAPEEFKMLELESCPRRKQNVFSFSIFNTTYILAFRARGLRYYFPLNL